MTVCPLFSGSFVFKIPLAIGTDAFVAELKSTVNTTGSRCEEFSGGPNRAGDIYLIQTDDRHDSVFFKFKDYRYPMLYHPGQLTEPDMPDNRLNEFFLASGALFRYFSASNQHCSSNA